MQGYTVEPLCKNTTLIRTPLFILRRVSNIRKKFSYIKKKKKNSIIRTLSNTDNGH